MKAILELNLTATCEVPLHLPRSKTPDDIKSYEVLGTDLILTFFDNTEAEYTNCVIPDTSDALAAIADQTENRLHDYEDDTLFFNPNRDR